ncbi:hypothetical protein AALP_AAs61459U000200 [Arabis alpina]|uniref:Uncharacterized protein n=1 Tax=Arabis alpina TaxID=50452 RepID=A0A087G2P2_ARAAL|nr:hypothetical protein AALP_AAs61459U000200 [Arabis alpina]
MLQAIDACLCVVKSQLLSTSLLPKPPDQPLTKPYDPPQPPEWPDPPDPPPVLQPDPQDFPEANQTQPPIINPTNHHFNNPPLLLHLRWVLPLSQSPWPATQGSTIGLTKSPSLGSQSDVNPPQSYMWWWSSVSSASPTTMDLTLRSPTSKLLLRSTVSLPLHFVVGLQVRLENLAHLVKIENMAVTHCYSGLLMSLKPTSIVDILKIWTKKIVFSTLRLDAITECKARIVESSVTRPKTLVTISNAVVEEIRTSSVKSESLHHLRAFSLGSLVFIPHG